MGLVRCVLRADNYLVHQVISFEGTGLERMHEQRPASQVGK